MMLTQSSPEARRPSFAIVIEWENARFAELERTRRMLRALREQILAMSPAPRRSEIYVLYDRARIDGATVARTVDDELQPASLPAVTEIVPGEGLRYYEQKNAGAGMSDAEVKIFLDCDVVPEPGWLAALLDAFDDPEVDVVAGQTYLELSSFYSRAFALFWFFPLRDPGVELVRSDVFHANNVAFRADVLERYRFPDLPAFRGQCGALAARLRADRRGIFLQKRARVAHPSPVGLRFFMLRALINGRDHVLLEQHFRGANRPSWKWVWWGYVSGLGRSRRRIAAEAPEVGLGPLGRLLAHALSFSYFSIKAAGGLVTVYRRDAIARLSDTER